MSLFQKSFHHLHVYVFFPIWLKRSDSRHVNNVFTMKFNLTRIPRTHQSKCYRLCPEHVWEIQNYASWATLSTFSIDFVPVIPCPIPDLKNRNTNATWTLNSKRIISICYDRYYRLSGDYQMDCAPNGTWSGEPLTCYCKWQFKQHPYSLSVSSNLWWFLARYNEFYVD